MATKKTVSKANPYFKVSLGSVAKKWNPMRKVDVKKSYNINKLNIEQANDDLMRVSKKNRGNELERAHARSPYLSKKIALESHGRMIKKAAKKRWISLK